MKLYFPESKGQLDSVGYNNLCRLFRLALGQYVVDTLEGADYRVYCNLPWHHDPKELKSCGLPLIVYTMYEATRLPSAWVDFLNNHADIIFVPSQWCQNMFRENHVRPPIFVLSGCYDNTAIGKVPKTRHKDRFTYLWQGVTFDPGGRKGADAVMKAFKELKAEARIGADAALIMKYRPVDDRNFTIPRAATPDGIIFIQDNLKRESLKDLYAEVDVCVNPTHGEGFGLIPLEQMAMGKPVIVTDWSMDYVDQKYCLPVKYELKKSAVTWTHKYLSIGLNGLSYNTGGLSKNIRFLPHKMIPVPDGRRVTAIMAPGREPPRLTLFQRIAARLHNTLCRVQEKTGLYFKTGRKQFTLYQEDPGLDAHVDIEDLKDKMAWCYLNRFDAEDLGFLANINAQTFWTTDRMRQDFESIKPCLETYIHKKGA